MIQLKNIIKKEDKIECNAFVESSEEPIKLVYIIKENDFEPFEFPKGFEYCISHIAKARLYFEEVLSGEEELKENKTIMWY
jgi:hypothetical protein